MPSSFEIVVIGAGVIGLSIAVSLQSRGHKVTVIDKEGPAAGASSGNAGAFAFTDILPLASPGILRQAPRWLMDPLGPLSIPPSYALPILPWLYRFWRASHQSPYRQSIQALTRLMDLSKTELDPMLALTGTTDMLRKRGNLQVYESQSEFDAAQPGWHARRDHGIAFHHLSAREMADLQPGLSPVFSHGTFTPGWYSIADPRTYTLALARHLVQNGGQVQIAPVQAITATPDAAQVITPQQTHSASHVILAAGAHSHILARDLGDKIPLETERGYNTTLPPDAFDLQMQITFGGHGFVISRLDGGIRVGGAVELAGLHRPPNFQRSKAMLQKAKRFLPDLRTEGGTEWMGMRPSLPDSLPVIGRSRRSDRVLYAFGHGHLGLTQSAGTARIICDLVAMNPPLIDLAPYRAQRFFRI